MAMKPKQLVRLERENDSKSKLVFDEAGLEDILNKVGTSRVALISGTGSARSGKSYFLNFVRRLFSWEQDEDGDWMGWEDPYRELEGFEWRGGKDTVTSGIWIWPEPLMAKTSNGEVIALLLMDTQGTLSEFTTEEESVAITSLCLLLSSVTIYNVKNDIEQENFQLMKKSLQLCSDLFQGNCKFQDLLFTVRDRRKDNGFDYGIESGDKYLKEKLNVKPGLTEDAKICRELINSSFKQLNCLLLPDPGEKVKAISHKGFLAEVCPTFTDTLEEIRDYFDTNNLYAKSVGKNVFEFLNRFKTCINLLNEHKLKRSQQKNNSSHLDAFQIYKECMDNHPMEFFSAEDVRVAHDVALLKSASYLEKENIETPFGAMRELQSQFDTLVQNYYREITFKSVQKGEELQRVLTHAANAVKDTYTDDIARQVFSKDTISEKQIQLKHNLLKEDGLANFFELIPRKFRNLNLGTQIKILETEIDECFSEMRKNWQFRKEARLNSQWEFSRPTAIDEYRQRMKGLCTQSFLEQNALQECHERVLKFVLEKHCNSSDYGDSETKFQTMLRNDLNQVFLELDRINNERMIEVIEGKLEKCLAIAKRNYGQELMNMEQDVEMTEEDFVFKNGHAKDRIRTQFRSEIQQEPDHIKTEFSDKLNRELEKQSTQAFEKFQSTRQKYSKIIEEKRVEIQSELLNILERHRNSAEILFEGSTEQLGHRLIDQVAQKIDNIKQNNNLPSKMLASAQRETIELIKNETKEIAELGKTTISDYKHKVAGLVEECFTLYTSKMANLEEIDSKESLSNFHAVSLKDCVQQLRNRSAVKDEIWLQPFLNSLEEKVGKFYESDIKKAFMFALEQNNLQLHSAKVEATTLYREAMNDYFKKTKYTTPSDLLVHHSKLCTKFSNNMARKFRLQKKQIAKLIKFLDEDFAAYENKNKMNTPTDTPAIGIDLGTTFTCVAVYESGETRIIPNEKGDSTFPSYVAFTPTGELVGHPAKEMAHVYPQNTIFDAKRLIGRRFNETTVQNDIKNWPFEVVNEDNVPKFKVQMSDGSRIIPPEQIAAKILHHVKIIAEKHLGKKVTKAVITVPAYFNDGQRQATKDAGKICGLDVSIITEPTAAAMAYHLDTQGTRHERNVLVYDLGGGTFDVVVLNMKPGGEMEVLSINGDTHLGGEDFDDNLLEEMVKRYKNKCGIDLKAGKNSLKVDEKANAARISRRLRNACEAAKINISGGNNTKGVVNVPVLIGETDFLEPISRKEFVDLNMDLFLKTLDVVGKALKDAKLEKGDIHDIVLVGGSTRIPKVQEMLSEYFEGKTVKATVNPDEAVARGAAIQAAILNGNQEQILKKITLKDVTPLSLGVEVYGGDFSTIIKRNTPLPANKTKEYYTAKDYHDKVHVVIYEGEEKIATDNHLLGNFLLKGIPKKRRGEEKILVNMEVDIEGILKVTAICASTGAKQNITIEDNRGRLTNTEKEALKKEFI